MTGPALYGRTAIVGVAGSDYSTLYRSDDQSLSSVDLAVDVVSDAVLDAGLAMSDIDGLIVAGLPGVGYESIMYRCGLEDVRFLAHYPMGGRLCPHALGHAAMSVLHGLADSIVMVNSVGFRSAGTRFGGDESSSSAPSASPALGPLYDLAYGMTSPGAQYGLAFSRYQHLYGATEADLAMVPVSVRAWAAMNEHAIFREPLTIDDYLAARYIVRPLRIYDYCLVNDGAAAYVVTTAERARDLRHPPVLIGGIAARSTVRQWYAAEDFWAGACQSMKRDLLDANGVSLSDIDCLQVYDNYSPSVVWALEGLGFAPHGEALGWLADGRIVPNGELPVNTSGGMLSEAYLQGWNLHVEAVRQLRGGAGRRQVPGCERVLYVGLSAIPGASLLVRGS